MGINFNSSVIFVRDINEARKFYEDLLEQKVEFDHGECISFCGGFSIWEINHAHKTVFGNAFKEDSLGNRNHSVELYFETDDLDSILNKMLKSGIEFVHPLVEQPWGQRVFRVYDNNKYIVELGEPMSVVIKRYIANGMTVEEVSKRTSMPLEVVCKVSDEL